MPSPAAWQPEVPCIRCGSHVTGIGWGELCPSCRRQVAERATRISRWIALGATLLTALYVWFRLPVDLPLARMYGGIAVLATYVIVRRIAARVATAWLGTPEKKA
ncbi:MAG TPA: hypothetical protein VLT17_14065 [Gemmatimonadales bacterium]|jgi:hypothetical protein|nr:hypothetical protein [Gemmatimonadales bacterium]